MKPFCFVLMPFGIKKDESGREIDFDAIYHQIISPAIDDAGLDPIRADEENVGGIIHKPMFERLMLCDYAVADLTTANPNVLYELGVRHGIRPFSTVLLFAKGFRLPFDVAPLRGIPYSVDAAGAPSAPGEDRKVLRDRLVSCRQPTKDSPVYQLVGDFSPPDLARLKTDVFRSTVEYSRLFKEKLTQARKGGEEDVGKVQEEIGDVGDADPAIIVDLLLSYRAVGAWKSMVALVSKMAPELSRSVLVREQLGFALNRGGLHSEAEQVLEGVLEEHGPSSETFGLLGRVYKDMWEELCEAGRTPQAKGFLRKAIRTYVSGFEADWRDAYPGINAVTLMEMEESINPQQKEIIPVVRYSVIRRLKSGAADYWDYATLLELSVLVEDQTEAQENLTDALAAVRERWEPKTTARNLSLILKRRNEKGENISWIQRIIDELLREKQT